VAYRHKQIQRPAPNLARSFLALCMERAFLQRQGQFLLRGTNWQKLPRQHESSMLRKDGQQARTSSRRACWACASRWDRSLSCCARASSWRSAARCASCSRWMRSLSRFAWSICASSARPWAGALASDAGRYHELSPVVELNQYCTRHAKDTARKTKCSEAPWRVCAALARMHTVEPS
jgi:hypothetical protein